MSYIDLITNGGVPEKQVIEFECDTHGLTDHYYFGSSPKFCRQCEAESRVRAKQENLDKIYKKYQLVLGFFAKVPKKVPFMQFN